MQSSHQPARLPVPKALVVLRATALDTPKPVAAIRTAPKAIGSAESAPEAGSCQAPASGVDPERRLRRGRVFPHHPQGHNTLRPLKPCRYLSRGKNETSEGASSEVRLLLGCWNAGRRSVPPSCYNR